MGRISKLRKQRRQGNSDQQQQPSHNTKALPDRGDQWLNENGAATVHMCIVGNKDTHMLEFNPEDGLARITIFSYENGQVETVTLLTNCDDLQELLKIRAVVAMGFATNGRASLEKRFYCQTTKRWITPIQVNLRLFYDLLEERSPSAL